MKNAYALLGLSFLIVFVGAYLVLDRAYAPTALETPQSEGEQDVAITANQQDPMSFTLSSPAFEHNGSIPPKYTCDVSPPDGGMNPELTIADVPEGTKSLVLLMHDPDIPEDVKARIGQESFDHWVLYNIDPKTTTISEGEGDSAGTPGRASNGTEGFVRSCPPDGEHRYIYTLYAVDDTLAFAQTPTLSDVKQAIEGHVIEETQLIGLYERTKN